MKIQIDTTVLTPKQLRLLARIFELPNKHNERFPGDAAILVTIARKQAIAANVARLAARKASSQ